MRSIRSIVFVGIVAIAATVAAQPPPMPPRGEGGPDREQIREKIQTMKVWKLTEEVGLTTEQSEKFFPIYNKHQKKIEELESERNELINNLEKQAAGNNVSDKEIAETTRKLEEMQDRIIAERKRFFKEVDTILPLKQRAKLMVFEERFRQRLQEFVRDIRREGRGRRMDE